jgi:hypothetical protein
MQAVNVSTMSDGELVARLRDLLGEERRVTAAVLAHLGEVEARELFLPAACSSMHVYSTRVLGMSDDQAYKRIRAARAVRRFPVVGAAVAEGRLHLCGVLLLAAHLSEENADELVAEASGKSKAEIQILLARRAPKPDVPPRLERVAQQMELAPGSRWHNHYEAERILGRDVVLAGKAARAMDDDLVAGLRRLGVSASDARQAVAASRSRGPVEERMRAALGALASVYAGRGRGARGREPRGDAARGTAALPAEAGP